MLKVSRQFEMGSMVRCPSCGAINVEGMRSCFACGLDIGTQGDSDSHERTAISNPSANRKLRRIVKRKSHRTRLAIELTVAVVILVVAPLLVYTQPWSTIEVLLNNRMPNDVHVAVYIDGRQVNIQFVGPVDQFLAEFSLVTGDHRIGIDYSYDFPVQDLDGQPELMQTVQISPLSTHQIEFDLEDV